MCRPITSYVREVLIAYEKEGVDASKVSAKKAWRRAYVDFGAPKNTKDTFVQTFYRLRKNEMWWPGKPKVVHDTKIGIYVSSDRRQHLEQLKKDGVNLTELFWEAVDEKYPDRERAYAYCANEMWAGGACGVEGCPHCGGDGEYDPSARPKFMFDL